VVPAVAARDHIRVGRDLDRGEAKCRSGLVAGAGDRTVDHGNGERVLILARDAALDLLHEGVDIWDLHHGNGTQHLFESDPDVLYVSTHQYPYYPGTGAADETGRGQGAGRTLNLPFPAGFGDAEYTRAFAEIVTPVVRQFAPGFVLVSAGLDCDHRDPLRGMEVTPAGFATMARACVGLAAECAGGRIAAVLEGGYDLA